MKTIIFILIMLSLYFGISIFVSVNLAMGLFSLLLILLATVFIIKKDSYVTYIEFVNPKAALLYKNKDDIFRKNHRITDIIVAYIGSAFMIFLSVAMPNTTLPIKGGTTIYLIFIVISTVLLCFFSLLIFKKSKKNSSYWFYFIALMLFVILSLYIASSFIF